MANMFYCIDLDTTPRDNFEECAIKLEARTKSDAAYTMAIFENQQDGSKARIVVADNPAGEDAVVFTVTQRVTVTYEVDEEA